MDLEQNDKISRGTPSVVRGRETENPEMPDWAKKVLLTAPVAQVAMVDRDGPYVVPLSFVFVGNEILFHGGEGKKSRALENDARICVGVTADVAFIQGKDACGDGFQYRSILAFGEARRLSTLSEISRALHLIAGKYDPAGAEAEFDARTLERTWVHAVRITRMTYKVEPSPQPV